MAPLINQSECLILRTLYKQGIFWRGPDSVEKAREQLEHDRKVPTDAEVDVDKVLRFANMTETPPPTRRMDTVPKPLMMTPEMVAMIKGENQ